MIAGADYLGLKAIIDLIFFNRINLNEQCFWIINNFLMADSKWGIVFIHQGLLQAILHVLDKTKTKNEKLMRELLYTLFYLIKDSEENASIVVKAIPDLHKRLANELGNLSS